MKYVLIGLLKLYRLLISPLYGNVCRYYPSCSAYALRAVEIHGAARGSWLALDACCAATPGRGVGMTPYREPLNLTKRCRIKRSGQQEWVRALSWRHNEV